MPATNDDILMKLNEIQALLLDLKKEEDHVAVTEQAIEMEEGKLLELLGRQVNRQFDNIMDWKKYIWETCEHKHSTVEQEKIDFRCEKTTNPCRFIDCFKNRI